MWGTLLLQGTETPRFAGIVDWEGEAILFIKQETSFLNLF